jgi:Asparagine synthase (glutamine-hydrolyzing)
MCGIAGQFSFQRGEPVERETIVRMTRSIAHRGPMTKASSSPDLSVWDSGDYRSLTSPAGISRCRTQETVWVIFNGEIYNYRELRNQLQSKGHQFRTNSDTEVIIHGYKQWGTDVFNHLNGMFGLGYLGCAEGTTNPGQGRHGHQTHLLQDRQWNLNFRFRDSRDSGCAKITARVDPIALNLFLRFRYTPSPLTIFQGIRKLAPGTMLVVEKGQCREERWYKFIPTPFPTPKKKEEAACELLELYRGAVKASSA